MPQRRAAAAAMPGSSAAWLAEERTVPDIALTDIRNALAQSILIVGQVRQKPGLLSHLHDHGPVLGSDHLLQELRYGIAMALDEHGLAAADIGDQRHRQRQIGFLPELADLPRNAVIGQGEILGLKFLDARTTEIG